MMPSSQIFVFFSIYMEFLTLKLWIAQVHLEAVLREADDPDWCIRILEVREQPGEA